MARHIFIFILFFFCAFAARADLVLEQQVSDTNRIRTVTLKLHGEKMRMDEPADNFSVIVDLATHDSTTLLTKNKTFMTRSGAEIRKALADEKRVSGGTNEMDATPAAVVDTGKTATVDGMETEIYTWTGARGVTETLWVAKTFPNYDSIRAELTKLDQFNDSGPHRNAQPVASRLPGMVIKSEAVNNGRKVITTLVSVKIEPVDASLFEMPPGYKAWKTPEKEKP